MHDPVFENEIVGPGSSAVRLTDREEQIAQLLSLGWTHKAIGHHVKITTGSVSTHVHKIAKRIPGRGSPTTRVILWYLQHGSRHI